MGKYTKNDFLFASRLSSLKDSFSSDTIDKTELSNPKLLLSLLKRNKVPLIYLDDNIKESYSEFFNSPIFLNAYNAEFELYNTLRNEWKKVRDAFIANGIESILIKSAGIFPYKSSNLDVLIKQEKRNKAEEILKSMGYIQLHNVEEPFKTLFRLFENGSSISVIHLHNKVAWINPFHEESLIWKRRCISSIDKIVDIPSPEDSILILTAHWFYEDKEITLLDILQISSCLQSVNLDWEYMIDVSQKLGFLNGFYFALLIQSHIEKHFFGKCPISQSRLKKMQSALPKWMSNSFNKTISKRKITLPFKIPKIFGKFLHLLKTIKDQTTTPLEKLSEIFTVVRASIFVVLFYKMNINIRYQPPLLITISGIDGSGKTTCAEFLFNTLNFCELKTRLVWSRVGSSNFIKPFAELSKLLYGFFKKNHHSKYKEDLRESNSRRRVLFRKSRIFRLAGMSILLIEMIWQYTIKVTLPLFFNRIVICDRYTYDTLVDLSGHYCVDPKTTEWKIFTKILDLLTPKPDLRYLLNISVDNACERKEVSSNEVSYISNKIDFYTKISEKYNLKIIDTCDERSKNAIFNKMIIETLTTLYRKWDKNKFVNK